MHLPSLPHLNVRWFGGLATGLLIGVLAVSVVSAASPAPAPAGSSPTTGAATTTTATTGAATTAAAGARLGIAMKDLRHVLRHNFRIAVDATNADGARHLLYVRGTIAVSTGSVTVTLPDNSTQAYTVDSTTVVRDQGKTVPFSSLADGQHALVFGTRNDDGSYTARLIRVLQAPKPATP